VGEGESPARKKRPELKMTQTGGGYKKKTRKSGPSGRPETFLERGPFLKGTFK